MRKAFQVIVFACMSIASLVIPLSAQPLQFAMDAADRFGVALTAFSDGRVEVYEYTKTLLDSVDVHSGDYGAIYGVSDPITARVVTPRDIFIVWRTASGTQMQHLQKGVSEIWEDRGLLGWSLPATHQSIAYDDDRQIIYRIDIGGCSLQFAAFGVLGPHPASLVWASAVDLQSLPGRPCAATTLTELAWFQSTVDPTGKELFIGTTLAAPAVNGVLLSGIPGAFTARTFSSLDGLSPTLHSAPIAERASFVESAMACQVLADPGRTFQIRALSTNEIIGTGFNGGSVLSVITVPLNAGLILGEEYSLQYVGALVSDDLRATRRYGVSGQSLSGLSFLSLKSFSAPRRGDLDYGVAFDLSHSSPPSSTISLSAMALAGLALSPFGGIDPIVGAGSAVTLDPAQVAILPVEGYLHPDGRGRLFLSLPIPDDPALAGMVVLFQMAADDGGGVIFSEIVGDLIQ